MSEDEEEKMLHDLVWLATSDDEAKQKVFDDMISFGMGAFKTELNDGKLHIKYVDPLDPTLLQLEAIERGEMTIEKLTMAQLKERFGLTPTYK